MDYIKFWVSILNLRIRIKNIYFKFYYSSKSLKDIDVVDFIRSNLNVKSGSINIIANKNDHDLGDMDYIIDFVAFKIKNNTLVICEIPNSRLLFILQHISRKR